MNNKFSDKKGFYEISTVRVRTVDQAVSDYFSKKLDLSVANADNVRTKVPVIFAGSERWKSTGEQGLRDKNGALILPILSITRTDIVREKGFGGMASEQPSITVQRKPAGRADVFARLLAQRQKNNTGFPQAKQLPPFEHLTLPFPDFCTMFYEINVWTQYQGQMNEIIEQLVYNYNYNDSFVMPVEYDKAKTEAQGYYFVGFSDSDFISETNFEDMTGSERIVKYVFTIKVPVYFILDPENEPLAYGNDKGRRKSDGSPIVYKPESATSIRLSEKVASVIPGETIDIYSSDNGKIPFIFKDSNSGGGGGTGPKGDKGDKGDPGPSGSQGPQGIPGPQGVQGIAGPSGSVGPSGSIGPSGSQGIQGIAGPSGAIGPQGLQGIQGVSGAIGPSGSTGPSGSQGAQGVSGPSGSVGPQGPSGSTGATGATGNTGATGPAGPSGSTGQTGPSGSQGPTGAQGPQGVAGPSGSSGSQGPSGSQGAQGNAGPSGAIGPQGPSGAIGATGPAGPTGSFDTSQADSRYVTTSSFSTYSSNQSAINAAQNTFSASVNIFTSSLTGIYDGRYVQTSSYNIFTSSTNSSLQNLNSFTASQTFVNSQVTNNTSQISSLNNFSSSINIFSAAINSFTSSLTPTYDNRFVQTASYLPFSSSVVTAISGLNLSVSNLNIFTGTLTGIYDGRYVFTSSFLTFSSSIASLVASNAASISSLNSYTASLVSTLDGRYVATSSFASFSSSIVSTLSSYDSRYLFTSSFVAFSSSVISIIAGLTPTYDARFIFTSSFSTFSSSVTSQINSNAAAISSLNSYTASLVPILDGRYVFTSSFSTFSSSVTLQTNANTLSISNLNTYTASLVSNLDGRYVGTSSFNAFSASVNSFTSSIATNLTTTYDSRYVLTSSFGAYTASVNSSLANINSFSASVNAFTSSADSRFVLTSSYTSPILVGLITGTLDSRYAAYGSGGGSGSVVTASYGPQTASYALLSPTGAFVPNPYSASVTPAPVFRAITTDDVLPGQASFTIIDDDFLYLMSPSPAVNNSVVASTNITKWAFALAAGTPISYGLFTGQPSQPPRYGIAQLSTGSGSLATNTLFEMYSAFNISGTLALQLPIAIGAASYFCEFTVRIPSASTDLQGFTASFGFSNATFGGFTSATNAMSWTYTHTLLGGNWAVSNGQGPYQDTGINIVIGKWYRLGMLMSPDGFTCSYYINGQQKYSAVDTTYGPGIAPGNNMAVAFFMKKQAGQSASFLQVDRVFLRTYDTTRPINS